ncbi:hypothetical protein ACFX2A_042724 [Malus domestica]
MHRLWTGRAPLPASKKKLKEFDSFQLPPPHKKGVKPVQSPGPYLAGSGPKYVKSREEICRWGGGGASSSERCRLAMVVFVVDGPAILIADELAAESTESEAQEWPAASRVTQPRQLLLPQQLPPVPHLHPSSRQFLPPRTPLLRLHL